MPAAHAPPPAQQEGLLEGLEMLKHALAQDHIILGAALREHSRRGMAAGFAGAATAHSWQAWVLCHS